MIEMDRLECRNHQIMFLVVRKPGCYQEYVSGLRPIHIDLFRSFHIIRLNYNLC